MRKNTILATLLLLIQYTLLAQDNFEGIIKFKLEYKDKTGEMSDDQLKQYIGSEQTYYLKNEKYKSELNGLLKMTTFYNGNDTLFLKTSMSDVLM